MLSHIRRVDIEYQSYCNRKCAWCPNTSFSREHKEAMSDETYSKILKELKESNFGTIPLFKTPGVDSMGLQRFTDNQPILSFLGYQEPLSNPDLLKKRVAEAWDTLPNCVELISHTNGDFLSKESLDELLLTSLNIMDYDNKGLEYWKQKMTSLGIVIIDIEENIEQIVGIHRYIGNVKCFCNWTKHAALENRGGFFKDGDLKNMQWRNDMAKRTKPCIEPSYYINIDYNGNVMPCCHMRADNPAHQDYILGNINDSSLVDIHTSDKANRLKEALSVENGQYPEPCTYCQKHRG